MRYRIPITRCNECNKILTKGSERIEDAIFDEYHPTKPITDHVIYAHCLACWHKLQIEMGGEHGC